jgi:hypothetical protein
MDAHVAVGVLGIGQSPPSVAGRDGTRGALKVNAEKPIVRLVVLTVSLGLGGCVTCKGKLVPSCGFVFCDVCM